jgi:hypothetical protein
VSREYEVPLYFRVGSSLRRFSSTYIQFMVNLWISCLIRTTVCEASVRSSNELVWFVEAYLLRLLDLELQEVPRHLVVFSNLSIFTCSSASNGTQFYIALISDDVYLHHESASQESKLLDMQVLQFILAANTSSYKYHFTFMIMHIISLSADWTYCIF